MAYICNIQINLTKYFLQMNNKPNAFAVSLIKYLINFLNT